MPKEKPTTIAEYIDFAPAQGKDKLWELYAILKKVVPEAKEAIKWGYPVFEFGRILFAFGAFKTHLNFMPTPSAMIPYKKELSKFVTGKGSIQFPYDKPLPKMLIQKIAKFRVKELKEKDVRWM